MKDTHPIGDNAVHPSLHGRSENEGESLAPPTCCLLSITPDASSVQAAAPPLAGDQKYEHRTDLSCTASFTWKCLGRFGPLFVVWFCSVNS
eukprot:196675-Amphidinium_carterae.1